VFKFHASNPSYTYMTLKRFNGTNDGITIGGITVAEPMLFGVAYSGGVSNLGNVFRLGTNGSGFTVIKHFTDAVVEGANPWGAVAVSGDRLYGTTEYGGMFNLGVVFSVGTNGEDFTVLKHFGGDAGHPEGRLVLSGSTLYGTTYNPGAVFRINTDGSGFTVLHGIGGSRAGLTLSGETLYGTVWGSPGSTAGYIFKMDTNVASYTVIKQLNYAEAALPRGDLLLNGEILFGTAASGGLGQYGGGAVFMMRTNGDGFAVLRQFGLSQFDAWAPRGGLAMSGVRLFGTTYRGGTWDDGTLFQVTMPDPPTIDVPPQTQTAEIGDTVQFQVAASGAPPLVYHWQGNGVDLPTQGNTLLLTNVQLAHAGVYSVSVTNLLWPCVRTDAQLDVIVPTDHRNVPGVSMAGVSNALWELECADAFGEAQWMTPESEALAISPSYRFDLSFPLPLARFYRARQNEGTIPLPAASIEIVPMVTLSGPTGTIVRLDAINRFGPTGAWWTLETVTLTNIPQHYFDLTEGAAERLYRIIPMP
jgi:uncharacterized repeat protein (TIGR03803 family)